MSEPIKYGYRALGGTFVVILIIISGTIALVFLVAGLVLAGFSWLPYTSPELLETYTITFLKARIIDPSQAFLLFFTSGLTLAAVGIILFGFIYYIAKTAQIIDKDFTDSVESTLPSIKVLKSRKGKAVLILGIMLFGTVLTFLALIFQ
ncbi:MAG: hypothetical protein ACXADY_11055 [Candidatus Hodarchaeales archaeon]|jgi:hypothetical protein